MKDSRREFLAACAAALATHCGAQREASTAGNFTAEREQVLALGDLTRAPAMFAAEGFAQENGIKAIFFEALPWKDKPTRVFAWLGIPEKRDGKAPAVVLVHGGGGTAFKEWVRKWTDRGYVAISIAVEGQTDQAEEVPAGARRAWKRHAWAGPARDQIYADSGEPFDEQWMYHAVADTVLANSLLRSLPEVDAKRVGLVGISWGGVITSTVIGIDSRFALAIPTYGCGHQFDAANQWGEALGDNQLYRQVWDPIVRMDRVQIPVLWLSWPGDSHFPLDCQAACYRAAPGPRMVSLIPGMKHGHAAGWNPPDSYAFADSVVGAGKPWFAEKSADLADGRVRVEVSSAKPLDKATLIWTRDSGFTGTRSWIEEAANLAPDGDDWLVTATLPQGATAWFVNVRGGTLTASSDYREIR